MASYAKVSIKYLKEIVLLFNKSYSDIDLDSLIKSSSYQREFIQHIVKKPDELLESLNRVIEPFSKNSLSDLEMNPLVQNGSILDSVNKMNDSRSERTARDEKIKRESLQTLIDLKRITHETYRSNSEFIHESLKFQEKVIADSKKSNIKISWIIFITIIGILITILIAIFK